MRNSALIFSDKNEGLQKKNSRKNSFLAAGYVSFIELHIVHTWQHMKSE